jgi:hypothetical protein
MPSGYNIMQCTAPPLSMLFFLPGSDAHRLLYVPEAMLMVTPELTPY